MSEGNEEPSDDSIERLEDGEVVYVHSEKCGGFCDYACNSSLGDQLAKEMNAKLKKEREADEDFWRHHADLKHEQMSR